MPDFEDVSVSDAQWEEVKVMGHTFIKGMLDWGRQHNMPVPVIIGAMLGMANAAHYLAKGCDCEACNEGETLVAAFTAREMTEDMKFPYWARVN